MKTSCVPVRRPASADSVVNASRAAGEACQPPYEDDPITAHELQQLDALNQVDSPSTRGKSTTPAASSALFSYG